MPEERHNQHEMLTAQAEQIRSSCPEFYGFLADRERDMRQALARLPHPADPENWASPAVIEHVISELSAVASVIGTLLTEVPAPTTGSACSFGVNHR